MFNLHPQNLYEAKGSLCSVKILHNTTTVQNVNLWPPDVDPKYDGFLIWFNPKGSRKCRETWFQVIQLCSVRKLQSFNAIPLTHQPYFFFITECIYLSFSHFYLGESISSPSSLLPTSYFYLIESPSFSTSMPTFPSVYTWSLEQSREN